VPETQFMIGLRELCTRYETIFIIDEIQSGYGRSGKFFAFQYTGVKPDLITVAKGMGNGFPIGGVIISPEFEAKSGMLGTTFGGNYLACAAGIAVLDVIKSQKLIVNAEEIGNYLLTELSKIKQIKEVRGKGLMIGIEFNFNIADLRKKLLYEKKIFTGVSGSNIIRLLPPLNLRKENAIFFLDKLKESLLELA
jgi:acetylornithine/N-succinyldiaminopimelate aminotransferase